MARSLSALRLDIVCRETRHLLCLLVRWGLRSRVIPFRIIVPCHRVVAADGSLNGYAGGLDRKEWLLRLEGAYL